MSGGKKARRAEGGLVMFYCPGCKSHHGPRVEGSSPGPLWGWNGSLDLPTFTPSILVRGTVPVTDDEVSRIMNGEKVEPKPFVCHSFVTDGMIQYLADSTHEFAGKTIEIPDFD